MAQLKNGSLIGGNTFNIGTAFYSTESGNIGFGIDTPQHKLDVAGNANISGTLLLSGINVATTLITAFGQANLAFTQANNVGGAVTTANSNIVASFNQANLAFTQANNVAGAVTTANNTAIAAFGQANLAFTQANNVAGAVTTANSNIVASFNQANTATTIGSSAFGQANLAFTQANNVGGAVTTANNTAIAAFGQANLAFTQANNVGGAVTTANSNIVASFNQANTATTIGSSAFGQANLAFTQANTATTIGSSAFGQANLAFTQANTATTIGSSAFNQANTATTIGSSAFNQANTATTIGSSAFNQANSAQTIAIAAFDQANTGGGTSANAIISSELLQNLTLEDSVVTGIELSNNITQLNLIDPTFFSIAANSTVTLDSGENATVTNSGNSRQALFDFGIPRGNTGNTGPQGNTGLAATIAVGTSTTGAPGTEASVTNSGNTSFAVFDFTIPRGNTGNTGLAATINVGTTTTGAPGTDVIVVNSGNTSFAVFDFTIPRGNVGNTGPQGNTGPVAPKAITVFEPVANDNWTLFYTNQQIILSEIRTVLTSSGSSPSVNASFFYGTNRTSGTSIQSSVITTSDTTGNSIISFSNGTIPANNFVWLTVTTASNVSTYHASLLT
jgi:hypothetical protein